VAQHVSTALDTNGLWAGFGDAMIDNFALALSHGLLLLAAWRLFRRPDLDREDAPDAEPTPDA
jgi:hypothetical protein